MLTLRPIVRAVAPGLRFLSQAPIPDAELRGKLTANIKQAMKSKDIFTSTVLRSTLAEIQSAEKSSADSSRAPTVTAIIRKAVARRKDAATQFTNASRSDLAERELREADLLSEYLPPLLQGDALDNELQAAIQHVPETDRKHLGKVLKAFYTRTDRSSVDPQLVKTRLAQLL